MMLFIVIIICWHQYEKKYKHYLYYKMYFEIYLEVNGRVKQKKFREKDCINAIFEVLLHIPVEFKGLQIIISRN